ncbi:MAG TPA: GNAT family N-acetyltransferase [Candidatus Thermoplasmatota archaeon]|nr:GNAT family N-acetyltransferase [Candidatus Thermoplasmatota archaeon]
MTPLVRRLSATEMPLAKPLIDPEGWALEPPELARLHSLGGAVGAFDAERLVGFLTFVDTPPYRWVGNVAVHPSQRGRGLGATLVAEAFRDAERAALYSVAKAVTLYERAGLVAQGEVHAVRAERAKPSSIPYGGVRATTPDDADALVAYDRAVTGMDRSRLLRALLAAYPGRIAARHGEVLGYAIAKTYADVTEIGPVVAQTPHAAWGLVDDILRATPGPHDMALHRLSPDAARRGFVPAFRAIPMFRGGAPSWDLARYHAAAGLEKG